MSPTPSLPRFFHCCRHVALTLASIYFLASVVDVVFASSSSSSGPPSDANSDSHANPFSFSLSFVGANGISYTLAVVAIGWGIVCLFFGVRLFKLSLFLITCMAVGGLTFYLCMLASDGNSKLSFGLALTFGIIAGCIVLKLFMLGLLLAGSLTAFIVWSTWLQLFPHMIPSGALYTALGIVLLSGALIAYWLQKKILLFATPVIGTFLFSEGVSALHHDPSLSFNVFAALHGDEYCTTSQCKYLYAGLGAICITGFAVQWYFTSGLREKSKKSNT